ncbi:hypothetical protein EON65_46695, partial [archaeon]
MKRRPWWHAILSGDDEENPSPTSPPPTFLWEMYRKGTRYRDDRYKFTLLNHIEKNACLVTKKGLYLSMKSYCATRGLNMLDIIPLTFYLAPPLASSTATDDLTLFEAYNQAQREQGVDPESVVWILKPASKTNRGYGIT